MKLLIKAGRFFFGIATIVYGILQLYYGEFRTVLVPEWPGWIQMVPLVYIFAGALIIAGFCISGIIRIPQVHVKKICLILAGLLFTILLFCHVPLHLFISPHSPVHLGVWAEALKELAFCGGALVIAGTYETDVNDRKNMNHLKREFITYESVGRVFFATTMLLFGVSHFYYTQYVSPMVPRFFGMPEIWTYVGGVALVASGICIMIKIYPTIVALLLASMLLIWFLLIHIPNAITKPTTANGNEIASAFDALLFCGVALVIAYRYQKYPKGKIINDFFKN